MKHSLPHDVEKYAESPLFTEQTVPDKLLSDHDIKPGVWARICVSAGVLQYIVPADPDRVQTIEAGGHAIVEPEQVHFVKPVGQVEFKVEFYR